MGKFVPNTKLGSSDGRATQQSWGGSRFKSWPSIYPCPLLQYICYQYKFVSIGLKQCLLTFLVYTCTKLTKSMMNFSCQCDCILATFLYRWAVVLLWNVNAPILNLCFCVFNGKLLLLIYKVQYLCAQLSTYEWFNQFF